MGGVSSEFMHFNELLGAMLRQAKLPLNGFLTEQTLRRLWRSSCWHLFVLRTFFQELQKPSCAADLLVPEHSRNGSKMSHPGAARGPAAASTTHPTQRHQAVLNSAVTGEQAKNKLENPPRKEQERGRGQRRQHREERD